MPASVEVDVGGHPMLALADRALFWPARGRLILSDLHLGKAGIFRRHGMAVPVGNTGLDLERLSGLAASTGAGGIWILGDFLHGGIRPEAWRAQWHTWREAHASLDIRVLVGNHDAALRMAPLGITILGTEAEEDGLAFRHAPDTVESRHVVCGHLHPVTRLPTLPGRWPIFWLRPRQTVAPAFSRFTGGMEAGITSEDGFVACVDTEVVAVPPQAPPREVKPVGTPG